MRAIDYAGLRRERFPGGWKLKNPGDLLAGAVVSLPRCSVVANPPGLFSHRVFLPAALQEMG
jgi:hypothetical protein